VVAVIPALVVVPAGVASAGSGARAAVSTSDSRIVVGWRENWYGALGPIATRHTRVRCRACLAP
jgi:hypothetical protein